jgi:succinate dehydrogenase / fumarate reductase cytochrome b subunit
VKQDAMRAAQGGMWPWLLQRVTAVYLVLGLGFHVILLHAFSIGKLNFATIGDRFASSGFFAFVDITLLAAALFHGLNGLRMVLLDYWFTGDNRRILDGVLVVVGVGMFGFGTWALWPWITG